MSRGFLRRMTERILQINDTPESIALGAAVGMFIAWTPTVGIQMIIMIIVGTVIRANRLAGVAMVYISNPFTLVPIYWVDYLVGCFVLGMEHITWAQFEATCAQFMTNYESLGLWTAVVTFVKEYQQIAVAMAVGGVIIGIVWAIPTYPITLRAVRLHQKRRDRRQALFAEREARRRRRAERRLQARAVSNEGESAAAPLSTRSSERT